MPRGTDRSAAVDVATGSAAEPVTRGAAAASATARLSSESLPSPAGAAAPRIAAGRLRLEPTALLVAASDAVGALEDGADATPAREDRVPRERLGGDGEAAADAAPAADAVVDAAAVPALIADRVGMRRALPLVDAPAEALASPPALPPRFLPPGLRVSAPVAAAAREGDAAAEPPAASRLVRDSPTVAVSASERADVSILNGT